MKTSITEKVIFAFSKQKKKILNIKNLRTVFREILQDEYSDQKAYKITHQLKNKGYLLSLKKDIFYITKPEENSQISEIEEKYYRYFLKNHCFQYCKNQRYVWGIIALEINLLGYSSNVPEEISIINKQKQAVEIIVGEKRVHFKNYEIKGKALYPSLHKHTQTTTLKNIPIRHANLELSILESLYNTSITNEGYIKEIIKKALKKNKNTVDTEIITKIIKSWKFNTACNKFLQIIKTINPKQYDTIKVIIKKYGNLL